MKIGLPFTPHRIFTGYHIPEVVMAYDGISTGAKLCLAVMYRFIGKNEEAWPRQSLIAKRMGTSERSVRDYLKELKDDGFLTALHRGLGQTDIYIALWHRIFEEDTDSPDSDQKHASGLDRQDSAGLDRQDSASLDRQDSAGPTYSTEESQLEESQLESKTTFPNNPAADFDYSVARSKLENYQGKKLNGSQRAAFYATEPPSDDESLIEWAKLHGILGATRHARTSREPQRAARTFRVPPPPHPRSEAPTVALALPACSTIPEFIQQCGNATFAGIYAEYAKCGMAGKITLPVLEQFWPVFCEQSPEKQEHSLLVAKITFPRSKDWTRMPLTWWGTKPWTASTYEPPPEIPQQKKNRADLMNEAALKLALERSARNRAEMAAQQAARA